MKRLSFALGLLLLLVTFVFAERFEPPKVVKSLDLNGDGKKENIAIIDRDFGGHLYYLEIYHGKKTIFNLGYPFDPKPCGGYEIADIVPLPGKEILIYNPVDNNGKTLGWGTCDWTGLKRYQIMIVGNDKQNFYNVGSIYTTYSYNSHSGLKALLEIKQKLKKISLIFSTISSSLIKNDYKNITELFDHSVTKDPVAQYLRNLNKKLTVTTIKQANYWNLSNDVDSQTIEATISTNVSANSCVILAILNSKTLKLQDFFCNLGQ